MPKKITLTCKECGKESEFTIWRSINTMLDPEMKKAVRDRSAFRFTCPHCGKSAQVDYGFLYHQMEDKTMIYYTQTDEEEKEIRGIISGNANMPFFEDLQKDKYLNRIVRSMNQLLEKLAIFDAGLDDRIVEICKIFIVSEYTRQHPDSTKLQLLMFTDNEKNHIIQIMEGNKTGGYTKLTDEYYNLIRDKFSPRLNDIREDREPVIDQAWALEFLKAK